MSNPMATKTKVKWMKVFSERENHPFKKNCPCVTFCTTLRSWGQRTVQDSHRLIMPTNTHNFYNKRRHQQKNNGERRLKKSCPYTYTISYDHSNAYTCNWHCKFQFQIVFSINNLEEFASLIDQKWQTWLHAQNCVQIFCSPAIRAKRQHFPVSSISLKL